MKLPRFSWRKSNRSAKASIKPVLFVTLFGLAENTYAEIVQVISRKFARNFQVVYCATSDDFSTFLRAAVPFEVFPSLEALRAHRQLIDWPSYLNAKWILAINKWRPEKILTYGMDFDHYLKAVRKTVEPS